MGRASQKKKVLRAPKRKEAPAGEVRTLPRAGLKNKEPWEQAVYYCGYGHRVVLVFPKAPPELEAVHGIHPGHPPTCRALLRRHKIDLIPAWKPPTREAPDHDGKGQQGDQPEEELGTGDQAERGAESDQEHDESKDETHAEITRD